MKVDRLFLEAALAGYQAQLAEIEQAMQDIRRKLGVRSSTEAAAVKPRRKMSAAARRRIAMAQKKRWAEFKKRQAAAQ